MKKNVLILISICFLLSLCGCGKKNDSENAAIDTMQSELNTTGTDLTEDSLEGTEKQETGSVGSVAKDSTEDASVENVADATKAEEPEEAEEESKFVLDSKYKYPLEGIFKDETFSAILAGRQKPVQFIFGRGGEGGYEQFATNDGVMFRKFVEAFRKITVEDVNPEGDSGYVMDGIYDYLFIMKDGSEIMITLDGGSYAHDDEGNVYVLGNSADLCNMNVELANDFPDM